MTMHYHGTPITLLTAAIDTAELTLRIAEACLGTKRPLGIKREQVDEWLRGHPQYRKRAP